VAAAVELLDAGGADALTVRALGERLATGRGAIYHYVPSIDALLASSADRVLSEALDTPTTEGDPAAALLTVADSLYRTVGLHSWIGSQLSRNPAQPAVFRLWKNVGTQLRRWGLSDADTSDAAATLVSYVLGSAAQYAESARIAGDPTARQAFLDALADTWTGQDPAGISPSAAQNLREHEDHAQFRVGVRIILDGIRAGQRRPASEASAERAS
jgi:AcrR family transcriptional regulator